MLEVVGLTSGYSGRVVVEDINLVVSEGEVVCVLGANGVGKSTLLRTIAGLVPVDHGSVVFNGADITRATVHKRVRNGLAFVPEGQQSFAGMSVEENLRVGLELRRSDDPIPTRLEPVFELFPRLAERRSQLAGTLSGGERQMLAIARALLTQPSLLMLDEPSHGLAPIVVEQIGEKIQQIAATTPILLVEQNLAIPTACATRVVVLENSTLVEGGSPEEVLGSERVISAYLGI